jgi:cephalosporin-C deacetylase-like acetyl esterase
MNAVRQGDPKLRRRTFLAAGLGALRPPSLGARPNSYATELPDMLLAFLGGKLNVLAETWDREREKIRTPADLERRNRFVREKVREMVHGFPERAPLRARTVARFERPGYHVENVLFESRPDFWVTGNLYVPASRGGRLPGIISPCGHYALARMQPDYQFAYLNLVHAGFVVLAYDPVGQGERRHYWNPYTGETENDLSAIYEHSMPGQVLLLMGEDLTHYRIWDGMRAIDYLLSRPEVDPERIGCAGHSGGGTLTLFISALDERVRCAVVNEGGTGHRWPVSFPPGSPVGPSDVEQNLFPAALYGIDLCDLHVAIAPRPLLALIEEYTPRFNLAAEHIRRRYELVGAGEKFATEEATDPHAWTVKLRLAATDWFCRWFYGKRGPAEEPEFEPEPPERLYCTPMGSVRYSQQGETIFSIIHRKRGSFAERPAPRSAAELAAFRDRLREEIVRLLRFRRPAGPLGVRELVKTPRKGYTVEKVEFLSEPGIYLPVWVFVPRNRRQGTPPVVYLDEAGKQAAGMEFGPLEQLCREGRLVVAADVRGIGETRPPHTPSISEPALFRHLFDVETAAAYMAWFMDESLFGMRVQDAVRAVDYALSRPDAGLDAVEVIGKGVGALWALFATALDERIRAAVCDGGLVSYQALARTDRYRHGAGIFIRDVLLHFDLPQVAGAVAGRRLALLAPVDAMKRSLPPPVARAAYRWTEQAYRAAGAAEQFRVLARLGEESPAGQYLAALA